MVLLRASYPQQIIAKARVSAFIRYLRAEICQHVTWEQRLQPYSANWLKPPLQTDPQQQITIEALVGTFLRDFGTMFATALPKLPEVTVANRFTTKIIIKAPVVASIRDFRAEIFKQVTWGQYLQPYCPNCLKSPLRTDSPQKSLSKHPSWLPFEISKPRFSSK